MDEEWIFFNNKLSVYTWINMLNKILVRKGILTEEENQEIRKTVYIEAALSNPKEK